MQDKILSVFYGEDRLPYKDAQRTVHYPIANGDLFCGANNTTQIRFYVDQIGGTTNVQWVATSKLPNGQIGNEVLSNPKYDEELGEYYLELELSSYYTSIKGDVYIALNGYQGGVNIEQDEDTGIWSISGTPTIQATGSIKLGINYAPQTIPGTHFGVSDLQQILGALSDKISLINGIIVTNDKSLLDIDDYDLSQVFFEYKEIGGHYQGRFYGIVVEQDQQRYWEELRFSQLDTQDINIYGSTKVWGELRITNNSRIIYGDNQLKFIVNGHTFALSTSGVVTIDNNELATQDYVENVNIRIDSEVINKYLNIPMEDLNDHTLTEVFEGANVFSNPFFANGTSDVNPSSASSSEISVVDGVLNAKMIGSDAAGAIFTAATTGTKTYFFRAKTRVTNSSASNIRLSYYPSGTTIKQINTPTENEWYDIKEKKAINNSQTRLYLRQEYPDAATALNKVSQCKYLFAIELDTLGLENVDVEVLESYFQIYLKVKEKGTIATIIDEIGNIQEVLESVV